MTLDTQTFFYIILGGFITVWTFRYITKSNKAIDSFEYLGLSAFWGLFILMIFELILKDPEKINKALQNQYSAGFIFSIVFAPLLGLLGGTLARPVRYVSDKLRKFLNI